MNPTKQYLVPAFMIVEAESAERADMIACAVAETMNNLPHGHGYASLRLDEGMDTIEQPADFPGESLLQLPGVDSPTAGAEILATLEVLYAAYARKVIRKDGSGSIEMDFPRENEMHLALHGLRAAIATLKVSAA